MVDKSNKRFIEIDLLRGLAMIIVIITHTSVYFLSKPGVSTFWNYIHFAVPILVFCSGYVLLHKYTEIHSLNEYFAFIKKRVIRLLKPFYIFIVILFVLELIQQRFQIKNIGNAILVLYPDIAWLVILFLELTILQPLFVKILKHKLILVGWFMCAVGFSFLLILWKPEIDYRWYMVIPWSIPFLLGDLIKKISFKVIFGIIGMLGVIFLLQFQLFNSIGHTTLLQANKYPPNAFYLSYGLCWLLVLYLLFQQSFVQKISNKILTFFSINSFELYFIHYILIAIVFYQHVITLNVWAFSLLVFGGSVGIQLLLNYARNTSYLRSILKKAN